MSNFAYRDSFNYNAYPYDLSLPEDLCREENQLPEYYSLIGENPIWRGNEGTSGFQAKFNEPKDDLLAYACENSYMHQDYWYNDDPMVYHGCPDHAVSDLRFYQPYGKIDSERYYDRISQVWSTSATNLSKLPNEFHKDSVEGKCIGKGYHSEGTSHEAKNFGSYFGRSKNSNSMEKDPAHVFENNVDRFSSGHNAPRKVFEDFPDLIDRCADNLAQTLFKSSRKEQNTSVTAEPEEIYNHRKRIYGEQWEVQLEQTISSLTAYVVQLEIQVEHLTHQVQDMADKLSGENKPTADHSGDSKAVLEESGVICNADMAEKLSSEDKPTAPILDHSGDSKVLLEESEIICKANMTDKLSGENKLTAPILDHYGDSKAILEESDEIISSADETTESKLFIETEDSSQKTDVTGWIDVSYTSACDWEIV